MEPTDKSPDQKAAESDVDSLGSCSGPSLSVPRRPRMAMVFTNARTSENLIVFANASFLELSGYESKDVLGESLNATTIEIKYLSAAHFVFANTI